MKNCDFCNFKDKSVLIYADKTCYAVISRRPINRYHVLVIPVQHYKDFIEIPDKSASHIFVVAKKLSRAVREACKPDAITHLFDDDITRGGFNLVEHYKFHIFPRFKNDRVKIEWNRDPDPGIATRSKFAREVKKYLER